MCDYIYTWKFNKKCRNVKVRLLHFWNGDSEGQMCYFFWIRCVGQQPEFCRCFLPFLLLLLLLLLYLCTLEYQLYRTSELLFHYFPLLSNLATFISRYRLFFFLSPLPLLPFILHFTSTAFEHHRFLLFLKQHRSFVITCKYCIVFMNGMIRFPFHFSNSPVSDLEHLYCVSLKQIWFIYGKHIIKKIVFFPLQNTLLIQATFLFSLHKFPRLSVYCRLSFYLFYNTKFLTFPFISTSLYVFVIQE